MFNCYKLLLLSLSVFMTGLLSLNPSLAAPVPDSSLKDNASSYQTAFLYFLPDYKDGEVESNDHNREYCRKQGYTQNHVNCPSPRILKQRCPVGNYYKECYCAGSPSCTGSKSSSNPYPTSTGASSSSCVDCPGNTLWTWTCSSSTCASYQLTSCPSRGYCSRCCDGYYKLDSCQSGYHIEGSGSSATCVETCVPLSNETGCSYGTESCSDGCGGTRTCCKACTDTCSSKGYYSSRPSGKTCSTTTVCGSTCYYDCQDTHTHSYSCPSGYSETNSWGSEARTTGKVCSCGGTSGTCYAAPACTPLSSETSCSTGYALASGCDDGCGGTRSCCVACDPEDRDCQCPGKVYCDPDTKVGDGATCTAGSKTFYERCLVKETCNLDNVLHSPYWLYATIEGGTKDNKNGWYRISEKCTKVDGTKIYLTMECNHKYVDPNGSNAPCKEMEACYDGETAECSCGGKSYCNHTCVAKLNDIYKYNDWQHSALEGSTYDDQNGYYRVTVKCNRSNYDGKDVIYYKDCRDTDKDYLGNLPPCSGMEICASGETPDCTCGGKNYCSSSCTTDSVYKNSDWQTCTHSDYYNNKNGYYRVAEKCTKEDGTKVYFYKQCNSDNKDANNDDAPCKGYKSSCGSGEFLGGNTCSCGGKTYYEACLATCNAEKTPEDCSAAGKNFVRDCYLESENKEYGHCE